jgi:CPA1 family monovalent cation:H+ antiporter
MRIWQILAIVAIGIAYGLVDPGRFTYALGHATFYLLLPPLLFEAAWMLNYRAIVRQWPAIATLAGPGVVLTAAVVAGALLVVRVPPGAAALTGAILCATDPIAVVAIFRRMRVPKTLATIVECESLFNDAVAVLLYRVVLAVVLSGAGVAATGWIVAVAVGGSIEGIIIGVAIAYVAALLLRKGSNVRLQLIATLLCAYGAYVVADELHGSGIFATIACGIALRYFERAWITLRITDEVDRFWDIAALLANVLVFFLLGAGLHLKELASQPLFVVAALVAIALSRGLVAGLLLPAGYPRAWLDVIRVSGMRGALSIALALGLPRDAPYRDAIIDATFAVVLATLAAGGLTVGPVVERATLVRKRDAHL